MQSFKNKNLQNQNYILDYGFFQLHKEKSQNYFKEKRSKSKQNILIASNKQLSNFFHQNDKKSHKIQENKSISSPFKNKIIRPIQIKENQLNANKIFHVQKNSLQEHKQKDKKITNQIYMQKQRKISKSSVQMSKISSSSKKLKKQQNSKTMNNEFTSIINLNLSKSEYFNIIGQEISKYQNTLRRPIQPEYSSTKYNNWRQSKSRSQTNPNQFNIMTKSLVLNKNNYKVYTNTNKNKIQQNSKKLTMYQTQNHPNLRITQPKNRQINDYYDVNFDSSSANLSQFYQKHKLSFTFGRQSSYIYI